MVIVALAVVAAVAVLRHDRTVRQQDERDAAAAQARAVLVRPGAAWDAGTPDGISFTVHNFSSNIIFDFT
jgi:hypothetical protein